MTTEQWRAEKRKKKAQMAAMQALPYEVKVKRAELRAIEFVEKLDNMGLSSHVSVGVLFYSSFSVKLELIFRLYLFRLWKIRAYKEYIDN